MAQVAQGKGDLVLSKKLDEKDFVAPIPSNLESKAIETLRLNSSGVIVDATALTVFFIDDNGVKHASNHASNVLEVTGTFTLNRRASNPDRIERTTGSFITDGFTVGSFVSVEGSSGNDEAFKITVVNGLNIEVDEDFGRIQPDEAAQTLTLHQGWQRLEGVAWTDRLTTSPEGKWRAKEDGALLKEAQAAFATDLSVFVDAETEREVAENAPGVTLLRSERQMQSAMGDLRADDPDSPTWDELQRDLNTEAKNIYFQTSGSAASVSVTFNAAQNRIERTTGSWPTDGFRPGMKVTVDGSASNDGQWTVVSTTTLNLKIAAEESLTQEGPVSVDVDGIQSLKGYKDWRGSTDEWDVNKNDLNDFMFDCIVTEWFARVGKAERDYKQEAWNATNWATSTVYAVDDYVYDKITDAFYVCNTGHTSGTTFADDAANWDVYMANQFVIASFPSVQLELT